MAKFETRSILYNFDVLSGTPGIFVSGHRNFSTLPGLIITILFIFIALFYTGYSIFFFLFERQMTVVELRDNFMTKNVTIPLNNFLFAFNVFNISMMMEYYWGKEINLNSAKDVTKKSLNNNFTIIINYINPENEEVIDKYYLETEYCEIGKNIDQEVIDKYNFTDYAQFLCLNRDLNFDILINQTHTVYIDIIISLKVENENIFNYQEIYIDDTVYLSNYNYLEFEIYTPNDIISNKNQSHPIKYRKNYFNYELLTVGDMERYEMSAKYIDYSSDKGFILQDKEKFKGITIESVTKKSLNLSSVEMAKDLLYYHFRYYLDSNYIESYERTYKKLPTILADITSVISLLITAGRFFISYLCKIYIETQTIFKILKFDKNVPSKIKIKKVNNAKNSINISKSSTRQIEGESSKKNSELISINQPQKIRISSYFKKKRKPRKKNENNTGVSNLNIYSSNDISRQDKSSQKDQINVKYTKSLKISNELININPGNKIDKKSNKNDNENKYKDKIDIKPGFKTVLNLFSLHDYFVYIFCKNKNNKTKLIDKISNLLEDSLSIEEIVKRNIDLKKVIQFINSKNGEEFNSFNIMKVLSNIDNEFIEILENEGQKINEFKI